MSHRRIVRSKAVVRLILIALVIAGGTAALPSSHARAAATDEHISSYDVTLDARADGNLLITETIAYDFGTNDKHGIYRTIPLKQSWSQTHNRVWKIRDIRVTQDGKKAQTDDATENGQKVIRIGDEDETITGAHTYVISYRVEGAFVTEPTSILLEWDALGTYWSVPIDRATVTLTSPAPATSSTCVQGSYGSTQPCAKSGSTFTALNLAANQGVTTTFGLPSGSIADAQPILRHKVTPGWFFGGNKAGVGVGALAAIGGIGAVVMRWRRKGRDERFVGQVPGLAPAEGQEAVVESGGPAPITSVAFTPPKDVRPAELAMLLNEKTNQRGVTATLVDLAVRGFLTIEEIDDSDGRKSDKPDHQLTKLRRPDADRPRDYEHVLLDGVFGRKTTIVLSQHKHKFATVSSAVQRRVEARAVAVGWFTRSPSSTKVRWVLLGLALTVVGAAATLFGGFYGWGAAGAGLVLAGIGCFVAAPSMPARTAVGSAVRAEGLGFRRYLQTAEAEQIRAEEREEIFNRYLPFAIAFDLADHWVATFQQAMAPVGDGGGVSPYAGWYVGSGGFGSFSSGMDSFSSGVTSAMTSESSSGSGGGSVGGGGGGGGGGSW